jgi:toxin ParE1/3/4
VGGEYKVVFGRRSRGDLKDLVGYIRVASGAPDVAERFGIGLVRKALSLSTFPERGRVVPELGLPEVREIIFKNYRIVYRVLSGQVQVLRFWHAARGAPEISVDEFTH